MLRTKELKETLNYHPIVPKGPIPTILDTEGIYPYESFVETSERPILKQFNMVVIENDYISVKVCTDLGAKVYSIYDKRAGKEVLYDPLDVRAVRILPRMAFVSGGMEFSFPVSHTPVLIESVSYKWETKNDRTYLWCGEQEVSFGMQWTVEFSLGKEDTFLTQRTKLYNPTSKPHKWMSWTNAAVPAKEDSEFHFPNKEVLSHSEEMGSFYWDDATHGKLKNHDKMAGFFWKDVSKPHAFGVYTPSLGCGLYHIADSREVPGIKLWTYGIGKDEKWAHASSIGEQSYIEIQSGPSKDQAVKEELKPGEQKVYKEFWIPSAVPRQIKDMQLPQVQLIPSQDIPMFGVADRKQTAPWLKLREAYQSNSTMLSPPSFYENSWPPSGMEDLGESIEYAAQNAIDETHVEKWNYYLGLWHAGRGELTEALSSLSTVSSEWARLVEARILLNGKKQYKQAVEALNKIQSTYLLLHPQVIIERDIALSKLGEDTVTERKNWLDKVDSLNDSGLCERRIFLLYDAHEYHKAKELLESTSFPLEHQRYTRTRLWHEINEKIDDGVEEVPESIGEDKLAIFGQYRTFEED